MLRREVTRDVCCLRRTIDFFGRRVFAHWENLLAMENWFNVIFVDSRVNLPMPGLQL